MEQYSSLHIYIYIYIFYSMIQSSNKTPPPARDYESIYYWYYNEVARRFISSFEQFLYKKFIDQPHMEKKVCVYLLFRIRASSM